MGGANRGVQVGGRRRGHPEHGQQRRKWAKVNSKIINKGEGRRGEEYILIYRIYTEANVSSMNSFSQRLLSSKRENRKELTLKMGNGIV